MNRSASAAIPAPSVQVPSDAARHAVVVGLALTLLAFLKVNHWLLHNHPSAWMIVPLALMAATWRMTLDQPERPVVTLSQLVGALSAMFALLHYPLMPVSTALSLGGAAYALLIVMWLASLACGVACFRAPALAILPPAYLVWSEAFAIHVTGLPHSNNLDIIPLPEIAVCLGAGLALIRVVRRWVVPAARQAFAPDPIRGVTPLADFAQLLVLFGIAIHLANYFWSFSAKTLLGGPPLAWLRENNPAYIFLAALQDHHVVFAGYPGVVSAVFHGLDRTYPLSNIAIILAQAAAVLGFFLPKRLLIALLVAFDLMHLAIIVAAGANFWPWIALNLLIGVVVARHDFTRLTLLHRSLASLLVLVAPVFFSTARLGWFDGGANNRVFIEAIDTEGRAYPVSTNFYTFYSYPISHMDYGLPEPQTAFAVGNPNGANYSFEKFRAARSCDTKALVEGRKQALDPRLLTFLQDYNRLAVGMQDRLGGMPYDVYPHHFYMPVDYGRDFARLDKHKVAAYVVKRESACLTFSGGLRQKVVSSAEVKVAVR